MVWASGTGKDYPGYYDEFNQQGLAYSDEQLLQVGYTPEQIANYRTQLELANREGYRQIQTNLPGESRSANRWNDNPVNPDAARGNVDSLIADMGDYYAPGGGFEQATAYGGTSGEAYADYQRYLADEKLASSQATVGYSSADTQDYNQVAGIQQSQLEYYKNRMNTGELTPEERSRIQGYYADAGGLAASVANSARGGASSRMSAIRRGANEAANLQSGMQNQLYEQQVQNQIQGAQQYAGLVNSMRGNEQAYYGAQAEIEQMARAEQLKARKAARERQYRVAGTSMEGAAKETEGLLSAYDIQQGIQQDDVRREREEAAAAKNAYLAGGSAAAQGLATAAQGLMNSSGEQNPAPPKKREPEMDYYA